MPTTREDVIRGLLSSQAGRRLYIQNKERFFSVVDDQFERETSGENANLPDMRTGPNFARVGQGVGEMMIGAGKQAIRNVSQLGLMDPGALVVRGARRLAGEDVIPTTAREQVGRDVSEFYRPKGDLERAGAAGTDLGQTMGLAGLGGAAFGPAIASKLPALSEGASIGLRFLSQHMPSVLGEAVGETASGLLQGQREGLPEGENLKQAAEAAGIGAGVGTGLRFAGSVAIPALQGAARRGFRRFATGSSGVPGAEPGAAEKLADEFINPRPRADGSGKMEGLPMTRAGLRERIDTDIGTARSRLQDRVNEITGPRIQTEYDIVAPDGSRLRATGDIAEAIRNGDRRLLDTLEQRGGRVETVETAIPPQDVRVDIGGARERIGELSGQFSAGRVVHIKGPGGTLVELGGPEGSQALGLQLQEMGWTPKEMLDFITHMGRQAGNVEDVIAMLKGVGVDTYDLPGRLVSGRAGPANAELEKIATDIDTILTSNRTGGTDVPVDEVLKLRNNLADEARRARLDLKDPLSSMNVRELRENMVGVLEEALQADIPGDNLIRELADRIRLLESLDSSVVRAGEKSGALAASLGVFGATNEALKGNPFRAAGYPFVLQQIMDIVRSPYWSALKTKFAGSLARGLVNGTRDEVQKILTSIIAESQNVGTGATDTGARGSARVPPDLLGVAAAATSGRGRRGDRR